MMNKPIKPKKPSRNDLIPQKIEKREKLLILESKTGKISLVDQFSHPKFFWGEDLHPNFESVDEAGFCYNCFEEVPFSIQKDIYEVLQRDFTVVPIYNEDGYYDYTIVRYEAQNPNYQQQLQQYQDRYKTYEASLIEYTKKLTAYEEYKKNQKKAELLQKLKRYENEKV